MINMTEGMCTSRVNAFFDSQLFSNFDTSQNWVAVGDAIIQVSLSLLDAL